MTLMTPAQAAMSKAAHACRGHKSANVIAQTEHKTLKNQMAPSMVTVVVIGMVLNGRREWRRATGVGMQTGMDARRPLYCAR